MRVNGRDVTADVSDRLLLADFLRQDLGLTGTHIGCEHGVCGACTVLVNGEAVRSCLMFAVQTAGQEVQTVEGLTAEDGLSTIQQAFMDNHALQCGFCTPGLIAQVTEFLREVQDPSEEQIRDAISGNLCRCTGYQNIVDAVLAAAARLREEGATA